MHKEFSSIFQSYELAHAVYHILGYDDDGKKKGKGHVIMERSNPAHWQKHLEGDENLGGFPLLNDNTCKWAAIDVDDMRGQDHKTIIERIQRKNLPLVCFRSTSGKAHLYVFFKQKVDAQLVRAKLIDWSSELGFSGSEIFPKQTYRQHKEDVGNWLSLPYFQGDKSDRYAFNDEAEKLSTTEFLEYVKGKFIEEKSIRIVNEEKEEPTLFLNGPPCLRHLESKENGFTEGGRNNAIMNVIVYLKKRYPDDWREHVEDYNQTLCDPPLKREEINNLIKTHERKDYGYLCKEPPIVDFCNKTICKKQKYGIGRSSSALGFDIDNMTKLDGDPVRWIIEIEGQRITLGTRDLIQQNNFREACVDALNKYPKSLRREQWDEFIGEKLDKLTPSDIIYAPEDASKEGQFNILLEEYCFSRLALDKNQILKNKPWWDDDGKVYFRSRSLIKFIEDQRFKYESEHAIWQMVRNRGGGNKTMRISGINYRVWYIDHPEKPNDDVEPVTEFSEKDNPHHDKEEF